ncbi:unnamed protein product [Amoebophrya sp. A120]|nr:unnamed protein product [Amoebophrya sp. A120]|eukprot:GSA120T00008106001.1
MRDTTPKSVPTSLHENCVAAFAVVVGEFQKIYGGAASSGASTTSQKIIAGAAGSSNILKEEQQASPAPGDDSSSSTTQEPFRVILLRTAMQVLQDTIQTTLTRDPSVSHKAAKLQLETEEANRTGKLVSCSTAAEKADLEEENTTTPQPTFALPRSCTGAVDTSTDRAVEPNAPALPHQRHSLFSPHFAKLSRYVLDNPANREIQETAGILTQVALMHEAMLTTSLQTLAGLSICCAKTLELINFLFDNGYNRGSNEDGEGDEGEGNHADEWQDGTGLGAGEGARDITDQIEDEAQLEGLKGDENPDDCPPPEDEKDTAKEVGFDLDGEAQKAPDNAEEKENEDENPEDQEEPEHDREMGDVDLDDGGKLDDKLWNGDEEEEDETNTDSKEDKKEQKEDIQADGGQEQEGEKELKGKEDEENKDSAAGKEEKDKNQEKPGEEEENVEDCEEEQNKNDEPADKGDENDPDAAADEDETPDEPNRYDVNMKGNEIEEEDDAGENEEQDKDGREDQNEEQNLPEQENADMSDEGAENADKKDIDENDGLLQEDDADVNDKEGEDETKELDNNSPDDEQAADEEKNEENVDPEEDKDPEPDETKDDPAVVPENFSGEDALNKGEDQAPEEEEKENNPESDNEPEKKDPNLQKSEHCGESGDQGEAAAIDADQMDEAPDGDDTNDAQQANPQSEQQQGKSRNNQQQTANQQKNEQQKKQQRPEKNDQSQTAEDKKNDLSLEERKLQKMDIVQNNEEKEPDADEKLGLKDEKEQHDMEEEQLQDGLHETDPNADLEAIGEAKDIDEHQDIANRMKKDEEKNSENTNILEEDEPEEVNPDDEGDENKQKKQKQKEAKAVGKENSDDLDEDESPDRNRKNNARILPDAADLQEERLQNETDLLKALEEADEKKDLMLNNADKDNSSQLQVDLKNLSGNNTTDAFEDQSLSTNQDQESDDFLNQHLSVDQALKLLDQDRQLRLERMQKGTSSDIFLQKLYQTLEQATSNQAANLAEQLRILLEPTKRGKLQGDYKTGKRLSMRKVISFLASNYRRDKIWLRRTKPSKREYQVLLALDNSQSMKDCGVAPLALQALVLICSALSKAEVGDVGVLSFGGDAPRLLCGFEQERLGVAAARASNGGGSSAASSSAPCLHQCSSTAAHGGSTSSDIRNEDNSNYAGHPHDSNSNSPLAVEQLSPTTTPSSHNIGAASFTFEQAKPLLQHLTFDEEAIRSHDKGLPDLLKYSMELFEQTGGSSCSSSCKQILLIVTDGRFNKHMVRAQVHQALSRQILPLLIIVDPKDEQPAARRDGEGLGSSAAKATPRPAAPPAKRSTSVFDLKGADYSTGQCVITPYLQDFPFPFYAVVRDRDSLPGLLADALRQWIEVSS